MYIYVYIYICIYIYLYVYIYDQYKQEKYNWKKLCVSSFAMFYFDLNYKENKVQFSQSTFKQKQEFQELQKFAFLS